MAFTPNNLLYSPSNVTLKDWQHAARIFSDDQFRLAPKHKFLYHVAFNINPGALKNIDLVERYRNEINVLVKSVDLPQYKITVETLNQYNRKKNVQTTHKFEPIQVVFHDDNMGLINQLWQNYYSYYYADTTSAATPGAYRRTATKNANYVTAPYGLDNNSTNPFFNYITIYQMARHEYVSYTLVNPIINSFNHNKLDSTQSSIHDFSMSIAYESVAYSVGNVTVGDPEGFGVDHYDQIPSSLQSGDDSRKQSPNFNERTELDGTQIIETVTKQLNTYQNTKENQNTGSVKSIVNGQTTTSTSGLQGFSFPTVETNNNQNVVASQSPIGR